MAEVYKTIKNHFGSQTPKIKQIFCRHNFEWGREFAGRHLFCVYLKCTKCGKFKIIQYYR